MAKRASLEELKKFANAVREAGGGNPLDALMPSVPADPSKCLIAKNLNFNCTVDTEFSPGPDGETWSMQIDDERVSRSIADTLGLNLATLPTYNDSDEDEIMGVFLPEEIGNVAEDFDNVFEAVRDTKKGSGTSLRDELAKYDLTERDLAEIWPYVEESKKEAYGLATVVNPDGSIVI